MIAAKHILTAICNIFLLFVIWQFYDDLFERSIEKKHVRWITGVFWFIMTYSFSELFHQGIINVVVSVITLYILLIPYYGEWIHKVLAVMLVECINGACDYLAYIIFVVKTGNQDIYAVSYVGTVVLAAICETLLRNALRRYKGKPAEYKGMGVLMVIPVTMLVIMICQLRSEVAGVYLMITGVCTLASSFVSFYLYNIIISNHIARVEKESLDRQVEAYGRELERIEDTERRIEGIRHDLKHHIFEMLHFIENNELDKLRDYIQCIEKDLYPDDKPSKTGKYEIDSLINYLIGEAKESLTNVDIKITIPDDLNVERYKLNIILGNLLENAIMAAKKSVEKTLKLVMKVDRNMLFIDMENSYKEEIMSVGDRFISTKRDRCHHGLGIINVKRIVQENDGEMNIETDDHMFRVHIMMYL